MWEACSSYSTSSQNIRNRQLPPYQASLSNVSACLTSKCLDSSRESYLLSAFGFYISNEQLHVVRGRLHSKLSVASITNPNFAGNKIPMKLSLFDSGLAVWAPDDDTYMSVFSWAISVATAITCVAWDLALNPEASWSRSKGLTLQALLQSGIRTLLNPGILSTQRTFE